VVQLAVDVVRCWACALLEDFWETPALQWVGGIFHGPVVALGDGAVNSRQPQCLYGGRSLRPIDSRVRHIECQSRSAERQKKAVFTELLHAQAMGRGQGQHTPVPEVDASWRKRDPRPNALRAVRCEVFNVLEVTKQPYPGCLDQFNHTGIMTKGPSLPLRDFRSLVRDLADNTLDQRADTVLEYCHVG
jgi:hypothetical protein